MSGPLLDRIDLHIEVPALPATALREAKPGEASAGVPVSDRAFPVFRMPGEVDRSGRVLNWLLWDGNTHKNIGQLRPEQRNLPIEGIWNDTLLRERIESEYTPAKDVL